MVDEKKIVLLTDFIEQKVRKEKELEYYTKQLEELQKKMFFLRKEIQLTNYIIEIVENEKVIDIREYLEDKRDRDS
jgi:ribosomal protein S4|tara:strand:- start:385 stop:612 length:228 start_codon:yes stop_codon:yes gene_type:complete